MPSKILATYETAITATITLTSIANGAGRISAQIDNTTTRARDVMVYARVTSGAAAPTAGAPYKLYLVRASGAATSLIDDAYSTADAPASVEPVQAEAIGSITCSATTAFGFIKSFVVRDVGPKYSIVVWNASGNALSATASDHVVQVIPINWEAQ